MLSDELLQGEVRVGVRVGIRPNALRLAAAAVELMRLLERAVRKSQAVDIESLCVIAGKRVWSVRCDITILDHCGNLTDAVVLAAISALKHFRLPAVTVAGAGDEAMVRVLPLDQVKPFCRQRE